MDRWRPCRTGRIWFGASTTSCPMRLPVVCSTRNNPVTYLAGCGALHDMFRRFAAMRADGRAGIDSRDFDGIAHRVRDILLMQADKAASRLGRRRLALERSSARAMRPFRNMRDTRGTGGGKNLTVRKTMKPQWPCRSGYSTEPLRCTGPMCCAIFFPNMCQSWTSRLLAF